jgi:polysaccharide biosynthesis protein PslH
MRVLLLTQVLPYPPDSGPKAKTWNMLKFLARQHRVTLVSFVRGHQSKEAEFLGQYCESVHTVPIKRGLLRDLWYLAVSLASHQSFLIVRDDRASMRHLVDRLSAQHRFEVIHADQLNTAQYALRLKSARKVLDTHNALWLLSKRLAQTMSFGPRRWLLNREGRLLRDYEGRIGREFDAVLAVSDGDKDALADVIGDTSKITVMPIAVDTEEFPLVRRLPSTDRILFVGTMFWPPNIDGVLWFIEKVYPRIRAERPQVSFDIIGARPPRKILKLANDGTGIKVRGYVEELTPYLEKAGVLVVPVRVGSGMRVKILNGMSSGLPIVSTSIGCEGIRAEHGRHLFIADTAEDFADSTLNLLEDPELGNRMGLNARKLVETTYNCLLAYRPVEELYHGAPVQDERSSLKCYG